jgi:hypothetical protein
VRACIVVLFVFFASGAIAQSWQCDGKASQGADVRPKEPITLEFDDERVSLSTGDYSYTSGKLDTKKGVSVYAEQEASDLSNERVTTSRMFRFELESGHLVFFDHVADHLLITADCNQLTP